MRPKTLRKRTSLGGRKRWKGHIRGKISSSWCGDIYTKYYVASCGVTSWLAANKCAQAFYIVCVFVYLSVYIGCQRHINTCWYLPLGPFYLCATLVTLRYQWNYTNSAPSNNLAGFKFVFIKFYVHHNCVAAEKASQMDYYICFSAGHLSLNGS